MIVYHGSLSIVKQPEIRKPNRTLDYGAGFYTTTSYRQAETWVLRRMKESFEKIGYINEYELNEDILKSLKCLFFNAPTEEWVDFVMKNRMDKEFSHQYDVVYGPVANDKVYAAFAVYEGGLMSKQNLIAELKTYKLVDQYLFHTAESLKALRFIKAEEVKL